MTTIKSPSENTAATAHRPHRRIPLPYEVKTLRSCDTLDDIIEDMNALRIKTWKLEVGDCLVLFFRGDDAKKKVNRVYEDMLKP